MYGVICTKTFVGFIFSVFFMKTCQGSTSLICCARLIKSSSRELVGSTLVMPRSTCHLNYCSLLSRTQFIGKDYYRPRTIGIWSKYTAVFYKCIIASTWVPLQVIDRKSLYHEISDVIFDLVKTQWSGDMCLITA